MFIIPAIDLLGQKAVRLSQGDENKAVVYSDRPAEFAKQFELAGAKWIHVVDLDGAFGREHGNDSIVEEVVRSVSASVELGGGIRSMKRIEHWLDKGVVRVILGSVAVENPKLVTDAVRRFGSEKIVVGIDVKDGQAAVHGWKESTTVSYMELAEQMADCGLCRTIVTDISSDGMLAGPRWEAAAAIAERTTLKVIISGGISGLRDIEAIHLKNPVGIEGVIAGKAVYEKRLDLREAVRQFQETGKINA